MAKNIEILINFLGEKYVQKLNPGLCIESKPKSQNFKLYIDVRGEPLDCPIEWEQLTQGSHYCYRPFMEKVIWLEAESNCQSQIPSSHLLSIHHETKNFNAKALFNGLNGEVRVARNTDFSSLKRPSSNSTSMDNPVSGYVDWRESK